MTGLINAAAKGRKGDTMIAHMTPGEIVIPKEVAKLRPDLVAHVQDGIRRMGGDASRYVAGNGRINPETGIEEFATQEEIAAAYQSQLGRAPDAEGLAYWSAHPDSFANGGFQAGVNAELASKQSTSAPSSSGNGGIINNAMSFSDYGGQQVRTDDSYKQDLARNAAAVGMSAQDYDKMINPDTYGARWGISPTSKQATTQTPQSGGGSGAATYSPTLLGNPTKFEVAPNQTVQGQLSSLMDPNSPIIQSARTRAAQEAAARGLSNSSLALTAGDEAAYAAAIPIATADAATFNNAAGYNANESNVFQQQNANASNTAGQFNAGAQNTLTGQLLAANTALTQTQMQTASAQKIAEIQSKAQSSFQGASNLAALSNNYQNAILQVGSLNIDAAAKQALQQNIFSAYQQATKALDQKLGIPDTSSLLHFDPVNPAASATPTAPAAGLDAKGNPIGTLYDANGNPVAKATNEFGG